MYLQGTAVSNGAAVGAAYLYTPFKPQIEEHRLSPDQYKAACRQLEDAKASAAAELTKIIESFKVDGTAESAIFQAHMELLTDEDIWDEVLAEVHQGANPGLALDQVFGQYIALLQANEDAMMRERADDLKDVRNRLLRNLSGAPEQSLSHLPGPVIVVAHDLLPADTATMDRENVLAVVTEIGGQTSHLAILARSYGIPAVLGVANALHLVSDGMLVAVDGSSGEVVAAPDRETQRDFACRREAYRQKHRTAERFLYEPCRSADGTAVEIGVNLGEVSPASTGLEPCADLVGLFRTEFLYMQNEKLPTEDEQFDAYSRLLRAYASKPVVLRTLDIGGDKALPCLPLPKEDNPFLGKRALRLCLDREDLFVTQLRAALRASIYGNLWIMFPMVGTPDDWRRAKALVDQVRAQLSREGVPFSPDVKLGIMLEIPSIIIMADQIVDEVDFASIGTNDLCQYTLAVDRGNPELRDYYQMYSPAVFRLIAHVTAVFRRADKPICVCGEIGGDEAACLALVGMGLRKLSMNGSSIAAVKKAISEKSISQMETMARRVLNCATDAEVRAYFNSIL